MLSHTWKVTLEDIQNYIKYVDLSEYLSYSRTVCFQDENLLYMLPAEPHSENTLLPDKPLPGYIPTHGNYSAQIKILYLESKTN